ncbi:Hypothetical protein Cul210932_0401 [Corynebacterium ulcerans]|nr:Hypothetical protein Cul210932_0401 [Corynebacterium ulcerans]ALD94133.1 Hypothetical protein Cul131001_0407 [Corynebacterium ulcerans]
MLFLRTLESLSWAFSGGGMARVLKNDNAVVVGLPCCAFLGLWLAYMGRML